MITEIHRGPSAPGLNRFRSAMPREYVGGWTLLKKCPDGTVFIGTDIGVVITATIVCGGDSPDVSFKKPLRARDAATAVRAAKFERTAEKVMFHDGAPTQTAMGERYELKMQAFISPTGQECVAGWDRRLKRWVVE